MVTPSALCASPTQFGVEADRIHVEPALEDPPRLWHQRLEGQAAVGERAHAYRGVGKSEP